MLVAILAKSCVYMYIGCPSWNCPLLRALQLGLGEEPIGIVGPMSQPRGIINTASLTLYHTHAVSYSRIQHAFSEITLL